MASDFYQPEDIFALGGFLADCYFKEMGSRALPIDPEIIATKHFGLHIYPERQILTVGVRSGIDTSQSVIFVDYDTYMNDDLQHLSHQGIAHELGHAIFDSALLRRMSATTVQDAFQLHEMMMSLESGIEGRANMLAGAFLVPTPLLIKHTATRIAGAYERLITLNPNLPMSVVLNSLAASQLSKLFCVSDEVIAWRIKQGGIYDALKTSPDSAVSTLNLRRISKLAGLPYSPKPMSERMKALLPSDLLLMYNQQFS